jgi:hypothetical protein
MSMRGRCVLVAQYVAEKFGPQAEIPSYWTLRAVWLEWFGPGGTRQRYVRTAAAVDAAQVHVVVHRPGQVVALDTTPLPVKVRDGVFGEPVSAHLTLALDLFTHSAVAFRLTLVSDTSVDVTMLLRDVMMPLPMRDGWGPEMEWPYPGVPASIVASFAGHRVAALPFFTPETVTTDHGSVYKSHALIDAQRVLGCNILPARTLRPQDKPRVAYCTSSERFAGRWGSCRSHGVVAASLMAGWRVGSGRLVEDLAFVVIPLSGDNSGVVPDLDGAGGHAEQPGHLVQRDQAGVEQPLAAAG